MPKILVITANSKNDLQLAAELRSIREALGDHSNFTVLHEGEVRVRDLIKQLLRERPEILHFAGHGVDGLNQAICVVDNNRCQVPLGKDELQSIFQHVPVRPRLVVLNACFSSELSDELKKWVQVVIGASGEIGDEAAHEFARIFYSGIAESCSVKAAFELAKVGLTSSGCGPAQLILDHTPLNNPESLVFYARPELMAKFEVTKNGKAEVKNDHYRIQLWLRGVDQQVDAATFQICHDSFKCKDRFWEVTRSESASFLTENFRTTGDVTIRVTAWSRNYGSGIETTLGAALRRHYGDKPATDILKAIKAVEDG